MYSIGSSLIGGSGSLVAVVGNGYGVPNSNPGRGCFYFPKN